MNNPKNNCPLAPSCENVVIYTVKTHEYFPGLAQTRPYINGG